MVSPELDAKLCEKYPLILADRNIEPMCWSFEHSDGWYNILDSAMRQIQSHINNQKHFGIEIEQVVFEQVKEKYGSLRIYARGGDSYTNGIISMAEEISKYTCEVCGDAGYPTSSGWIRTLCSKHHVE